MCLQRRLAGYLDEQSQTAVAGQEKPGTEVDRKSAMESPVCVHSRYETRLSSSPTRKPQLTTDKQKNAYPPVCNDSVPPRTSTTCEPTLGSSQHGSTLLKRRRSSRSFKVTQSEEPTADGQHSSMSPKCDGATLLYPVSQLPQLKSGKSPQSQYIRGTKSQLQRFSPRKTSVSPVSNAVSRRQRMKSVDANTDQQHVGVDGSVSSPKSDECFPNVSELQSPAVADSTSSSQKMTPRRRSSRKKMSSSEAGVTSDASVSRQVKVEAMCLGDEEPLNSLSQQQDEPANKVAFTKSEEPTVDGQNSSTSPKCNGAMQVSPVRQSPQLKLSLIHI